MLKQALEYEAQLKILLNRASIEIDNQWYFGNPGGYTYEIADNTVWRRDFVSVDAEDNVIGLINYNIDCHSGNTYKWGLISFKKGNLILMKDLETAIVDVFEKYRLNRISFCCFVGNPALRGYSHLIDKLGGTQCGYKHATCRLLDNRLYDEVDFEILAKDYFNSEYYLKNNQRRTN